MMRSAADWALPFVLSIAVGFGSTVGFSFSSPELFDPGTRGDMTGAIGVVVLMLSASISLVVSAVTIVVARLRRRGVPRWCWRVLPER